MKKHLQLPSLTTFLIFAVILGCTAGASDPASTNTDLSNYYTKSEADTKFATKQDLEVGSVSNDPDVYYGPGYMNYCAYKTKTYIDYQVNITLYERESVKILLTNTAPGSVLTIYSLPMSVFVSEVNKNNPVFTSNTDIVGMAITSVGGSITCFTTGCDTTALATATRNLVNEILTSPTYDGRFSAYIQPNIALFDLIDNRFKSRCTS